MANRAGLILVIMIGLIVILACRNDESISFKADGKEWNTYDLDQTEIKVDLPGRPSDKTPDLAPNLKTSFSAVRIYSYDDKGFHVSITEMTPTAKINFPIKVLADTSIGPLKDQLSDLTYTLDIKSETNLKYNGAFTKGGNSFDLRGCYVYKNTEPRRMWEVLTLYPKENVDARNAGQRVIDSVVFKSSSEECK